MKLHQFGAKRHHLATLDPILVVFFSVPAFPLLFLLSCCLPLSGGRIGQEGKGQKEANLGNRAEKTISKYPNQATTQVQRPFLIFYYFSYKNYIALFHQILLKAYFLACLGASVFNVLSRRNLSGHTKKDNKKEEGCEKSSLLRLRLRRSTSSRPRFAPV